MAVALAAFLLPAFFLSLRAVAMGKASEEIEPALLRTAAYSTAYFFLEVRIAFPFIRQWVRGCEFPSEALFRSICISVGLALLVLCAALLATRQDTLRLFVHAEDAGRGLVRLLALAFAVGLCSGSAAGWFFYAERANRPKFQYSLRGLLLVMVSLGILMWLFVLLD